MSSTELSYFDYAATTPVDPEVLEAYVRACRELYANPASDRNALSWKTHEAVEVARLQVADLVHCQTSEVFFTSGATEACNWVLQTTIQKIYREQKRPARVLTLPVEHPAVSTTLHTLKSQGLCTLSYFDVATNGSLTTTQVPPAPAEGAEFDLATLMWVQNELGNIYPVEAIAAACQERKILLFTDATQAVGKIPVDFAKSQANFLCFSGHKIYAPKGVGALIRRQGTELMPLLYGGGQERGMRSGTSNVASVLSMGKACEKLRLTIEENFKHATRVKEHLQSELTAVFPKVRWNSLELDTSPFILSGTFIGLHVPAFFKDVAISKTSACKSGPVEVSSTLDILQFSTEEQSQTLRLSFSHLTSFEECRKLVSVLKRHIVERT